MKIQFNKKFVYKKVSEASTSQVVSVSDPVQQSKCEKCHKFFISKEFLDKHILSVHTEIPASYNISIFNPNAGDIEDSQLVQLEDIESIINMTSEDSSLLKEDCMDVLFRATEEKAGFLCKVCQVYLETRQELQKHKKTHKKPVGHRCEECGAEFTSSQTLKSHIQTRHEGIKKVCSVCLKPVVDLTRHIRVQHKNGDTRNFHCDICDSKFRLVLGSVEFDFEIIIILLF